MTARKGRGPIEVQRARNAALQQQAEALTAEYQPSTGALPVVVLPANTRATVPLPEEAIEAFVLHVRTQIAAAFALPLRDNALALTAEESGARDNAGETGAPGSDDMAYPFGALLGNACATCRGECCTAGGTRAFLKPDSLARVRAHQAQTRAPGGSAVLPQEIEALYVAALPGRHYRGSCVFHTREGCALPRGLRSNLCNRFVCTGLTQLARAMTRGDHRAAFVAAADSVHLRRVARLDEASARTLPLRP